MQPDPDCHARLPTRHDRPLMYACSLVIACLMVAASAAGLGYPDTTYPTDELRRAFVPNPRPDT